MVCELCGKAGPMSTAIIEGTKLTVCKNCAKMGKIVEAPKQRRQHTREEPKEETIEVLVADIGKKIREARENSGLTQEEFANKLNEKASIVQKIESGAFKPTIEKAKDFQRKLGIKLVEEETETSTPVTKSKGGALTIGDIIKVK